jgi:hypothetical protein
MVVGYLLAVCVLLYFLMYLGLAVYDRTLRRKLYPLNPPPKQHRRNR